MVMTGAYLMLVRQKSDVGLINDIGRLGVYFIFK